MRHIPAVPALIGRVGHLGALRSTIAMVTAAATLGACATWRQPPGSARDVVAKETVVRAHLRSGQAMEVYRPVVAGDSLTGWRTATKRVAVALADVTSVEVQRTSVGNTVLLLVGVGAAMAAVVGVAALSDFMNGHAL